MSFEGNSKSNHWRIPLKYLRRVQNQKIGKKFEREKKFWRFFGENKKIRKVKKKDFAEPFSNFAKTSNEFVHFID